METRTQPEIEVSFREEPFYEYAYHAASTVFWSTEEDLHESDQGFRQFYLIQSGEVEFPFSKEDYDKNEDIQDHQYLMFLKYAWAHNCKVHCLGMTRKPVLDKVPFDYVDSSSWTQGVLYGRIGTRKLKNAPTVEERRTMRQKQWEESYRQAMKMQEHYEAKWASTTRKLKEGLLNT